MTLKAFIASYPWGRAVFRMLGIEFNGLFTVPYPEVRLKIPERFRYFPFLVYDATPEQVRCVACKICEKECPPQCIYIEMEKDAQGRPTKQPKRFEIDVSLCMSCNICVEVCPFDAIEMDQVFEVATYERFAPLVYDRAQLSKSAAYFTTIKPVEAAVVDARLKAKAEKKTATPGAARTAATPPPSS